MTGDGGAPRASAAGAGRGAAHDAKSAGDEGGAPSPVERRPPGAGGAAGGVAGDEGGAPSPRTILVLGGGGLKGLAHVGAWRALAEHGVRPDAIVGASIGALVGALIAAGMDADALADEARRLTKDDILRLNRRVAWIRGVKQTAAFMGDHYRAYIRRVLPVERWGDFRIPLRVNAVSLATGRLVWFGAGARTDIPPADAVYASCALPLYYPPLEAVRPTRRHPSARDEAAGGRQDSFVDGGMLEPLPLAEAARWGAERIIAVDVGADFAEIDPEECLEQGLIGIHQRVMEIRSAKLDRLEPEWDGPPLVRVRPEIGHLGTFEFGHAELAMERGYAAMVDALRRWEPAPTAAEHVAAHPGKREAGGAVDRWLQRVRRVLPF